MKKFIVKIIVTEKVEAACPYDARQLGYELCGRIECNTGLLGVVVESVTELL